MKREKLNRKNLQSGIDTLSIVSPEISSITPSTTGFVKSMQLVRNQSHSGDTLFEYLINPNNTMNGEVFHFSVFKKVMEDILNDMGISHFHKSRVDFRIDSYQDNYNELHKLNKCVILLLSIKYKLKNRYESTDPLSLEHLTTVAKGKYIEAKNYNKGLQEPNGDVQNRLELRSKALGKDKEIPALVRDWARKLDDLPEYFLQLQTRCNEALISRWSIEKGKEVKTVSEFIRKYQDNIYCRQQLISFFEAIGANAPAKSADNFKARNRIEYFSLKDLKTYLKMIEKSLTEYLQK